MFKGIKGIAKTIENEAEKQKGGFLGILLETLGAIWLGNMLSRKGIVKARYGNKEGKGTLTAGYGSNIF